MRKVQENCDDYRCENLTTGDTSPQRFHNHPKLQSLPFILSYSSPHPQAATLASPKKNLIRYYTRACAAVEALHSNAGTMSRRVLSIQRTRNDMYVVRYETQILNIFKKNESPSLQLHLLVSFQKKTGESQSALATLLSFRSRSSPPSTH